MMDFPVREVTDSEEVRKVFAVQIVRSGQAFRQSGITGCSGQHGISPDIASDAIISPRPAAEAMEGVETGAVTSPRRARIDSTRRRVSQSFTHPRSHIIGCLGRSRHAHVT
jgi:hypothetical protein